MYWNSIVFTGTVLNSFNDMNHLCLSNSYRRVPWYCSVPLGISCQSSSPEMLTVWWLYLALDYDMSFHGPQACWRAEEHCTAALPEVRRNRLHPHPLAAASAPRSALLCLALFPVISGLSLRQSDVHCVFSQPIPRVKSRCASPTDGPPPGCGAVHLTRLCSPHLQICCWMWIRNS